MEFCSDQTGKIVLLNDAKNYLRFLYINNKYFNQKFCLKNINFFEKIIVFLNIWENKYKKKFNYNKKREFIVIGYISNTKKLSLVINKKKKVLKTLLINSIDSFCNFKNNIYILSKSKVFVFTILGGEFTKIFCYEKLINEKFNSKIENSYNGKLLFIISNFFFILEQKNGIILKKIEKKLGGFRFFGLYNKSFLIFGEKSKKIKFLDLKKNKIFFVKNNNFLSKKKSICRLIIRKKTYSELILTHNNKTIFLSLSKIAQKNNGNFFGKILEIKTFIKNIDFLQNGPNLILLTSLKKNFCPILIKNSKVFEPQRENSEKSNRNKQTTFSTTIKKRKFIRKRKKILYSIIKKNKRILGKKNSWFQINYKVLKKKPSLTQMINKKIFKKFRFFLFTKSSATFKKISPFFETSQFLYHNLPIESISPVNYLNLFLKEFEIKKTTFPNFFSWIENLYISHFTWMSKNLVLQEIVKRYKFFHNKTKLENIKNRFITHFSLLLKEIVNFNNYKNG
jgi:hypothetical protein